MNNEVCCKISACTEGEMMKCTYCQKEIAGKPLQIGPKKLELAYCDKRCNVFNNLKKFPGTSLAGMIKTMYPEYVKEYFELMGADNEGSIDRF